jgi:hypothetical protein
VLLILSLCPLAGAVPVYWTSPPDAAALQAVSGAVPDAEARPFDALLPSADAPYAAIDLLASEYGAVLPLVDVFDGELQIMARLAKATADVRALRSPADRDLLVRALQLNGFAVARTYQDDLATDPAAAPYRRALGATAVPAAWLDAAALATTPAPSAEAVPEPALRLAYDSARASVEAMPRGAIVLGHLATSATVTVDGRKVTDSGRVSVVPGRHFVTVQVGNTVLATLDPRVEPGMDVRIDIPYGPVEHERLRSAVQSPDASAWNMPEAAYLLSRIGEPRAYVAVPDGPRTRVYALDGANVARIPLAGGRAAPATDAEGWHADVAVAAGGAWAYAPDWYTVHAGSGAPHAVSTVNAGAPLLTAQARARNGLFAATLGVDGAVALGEWHDWPTGDSRTRAFLYPHVGVGLPWLQVTAGPLFPFWFGVGARADVPLTGPLELHVGAVRGLGITAVRDDGSVWDPYGANLLWAGIGARLGPTRRSSGGTSGRVSTD